MQPKPLSKKAIVENTPILEPSNLTQLQFLYWVSQVMRPEAAFLNTIAVFDLPGQVDVPCFKMAFEALVQQSDSMRTVIQEHEGVPQRLIVDNLPAELHLLDFSGEENPHLMFEEWLPEQAKRPFVITEALYDSVLVKLSESHFRWYINQHHIIADAQAFFAAFTFIKQGYETAVSGHHDIQLALPPYQAYVDYEHAFRQSPRYRKASRYWQKKLSPGPDPLRFNGKAPAKKNANVTQITIDLGLERSEKVCRAAMRKDIFTLNEELSLYNLFAALFFIQLQRMSQNKRLGVITPVHNRTTDHFRQTIGLLMEICPLQVTFTKDDTFQSVIKNVRKETRSTIPQAQYGSALTLPSETFDVMFNMHQIPIMQLGEIPVKLRKYHPGVGSDSLACQVHHYLENGNFLINLEFNNDIFSAEQQQETADQFVDLVDAFLKDSTQPLNLQFAPPLEIGINEEVDGSGRPNFEPPSDAMEKQMARLWEEVLGIQPIGIHDNFFDSGGSSFLASKLFLRVQDVMGQKLPLSTLLEAKTVADMVRVMREKSEGRMWTKTVTMKSGKPNAKALFFVPGAGGSLIRLDGLMGLLSDDLRVVAFQLPGLNGEREPFQTVPEAARYFIDVMREIQPEGPYRIGGYSWGGMIAFNMAYQLMADGQEIEFLAIMDTPAQNPNYRFVETAVDRYAALRRLNQQQRDQTFLAIRDKMFRLEYFLRKGVQLIQEQGAGYIVQVGLRKAKPLGQKLFRRPKPTVLANSNGVVSSKAEPNGTNHQDQAGDFWSRFNLDDNLARFVRANDRAIRLYIPQAYSGKAFLFYSSKGYRNALNRSASPQLGWGAVIKGGVESYRIPGDHLGMLVEPNVRILAQKLQHVIDKTIQEKI